MKKLMYLFVAGTMFAFTACGGGETATEETTAAEVEKTWRDDLPSELQGIKTLEKFKDVSGLAKSYVETEKYFEGAVRIPGEGATDDDWSSFYGKLGRPDTAEDYDFEKAEMPDGMEYNSDFEKQYLEMAHKNGYSNAQVKAGYDWYNGISKNAHVDQTVVKENNIQNISKKDITLEMNKYLLLPLSQKQASKYLNKM
jgi:hypothetical protein